MAWKPWYMEMAEMNSQREREEFMRGVFGFRPRYKRPIIAGLIAGYSVAKMTTKAKKKK